MRKYLVFGLVAVGILSGCCNGYDAAMNIKKDGEVQTLIGSFEGSLAVLQGSTKTATIDVTNGEVNCTGYSDKGKFSTNMTKNKVRHTFIINCDDGRTGAAQVTVNARSEGFGLSANGVGIGSLSDGSKVRLVIGEMSGSLAWWG